MVDTSVVGRGMWGAMAALSVASSLGMFAGPARASAPCPAPEAPEVSALDYALTGIFAVGALSADLWMRPPTRSPWRGGALFDDDVRGALRLDSATSRSRAAIASDALELTVLVAMPLLDLSFAAGRGQASSGWRMLVIDMELLAATRLLVVVEKNLVGRERPYQRECDGDDDEADCGTPESRRSFVSGHAALSFAAAGLVCVEHLELDLFGGGAGDTAACVVATAIAGATGVLRIVADRHYATDVLAGAAVGFVSGWVLPYLLHYRSDGPALTVLVPMLGDELVGISTSGRF